MSENKNTVYVFVKGNEGKCAYEITDNFCKEIHSEKFFDLKDDQGKPLHQTYSDWEAIIKSLEYIRDTPSVPM